MRRYQNLPSIGVELQDGNLRLDKTPVGPVTLVIGTATDGPNATQYLATDSNVAAQLFGTTSPLVKRAAELKLGGTKNILMYRIGGVAASIQGLFGTGSEITAKEMNVLSNTKYKVYIGPNPDGVTSGTVLIIFSGDNNTIIYSNVPGGEVVTGLFDIVGFDTAWAHRVGTPTSPVVLSSVSTSVRDDFTDMYTVAGGGESTHNLAGSTVVGSTVTKITVNGVTLVAGTGAGKYVYVDSTDVVTWGTGLVAADAVVITYSRPNSSLTGVTYTAGADNIGCTWEKLYELLDGAYTDLETTLATEAFVDKAILDAPNLADGSSASDKLNYLRIDETDGVKTYTWKAVKTEYQYSGSTSDATHDPVNDTTTVLADADKDANGQPIVKYAYSEVNFAHQLGMWCENITDNDRFVNASIGTSLPVTTSTANVAKWIGTLPETDAEGNVVSNGTGLLGNKFMSGTTTRSRGFFATDSGLVDGNVLTDSNGVPVDLGKFLSIVASPIVTPNSATVGSVAALVNGGAVYASITSTITPGNSTTNVPVPGIALPFVVKKIKLNELTGARYVTFTDTPQGVAVVSGSLASAPTSDYTYVSTSIIVSSLVTSIRAKLQPYLGKGISQTLLSAANTAVEAILQAAVEDGAITKYSFSIKPGSNQFSLLIPLKVVPVFELRAIDVMVALAFNI